MGIQLESGSRSIHTARRTRGLLAGILLVLGWLGSGAVFVQVHGSMPEIVDEMA